MNKIVDYYQPNDERMDEYYFGHIKLLGLDKHPFGLDQNGTLRFEEINTGSKIWKDHETQDLNKIWSNYYHGHYTMDELMQFYREIGYSLCGYVDVWSDKFYAIEDSKEFEKALVDLEGIEHIENAKKEILESIFLAHLNSVDDEIVFKYRKEAKSIISKNFGPEVWNEFVESIQNKNNEG